MYDELVKALRDFAVELRKADDALLIRDSADAIEELSLYESLYRDMTEKGQQTARKLIDAYPKWIPVTERLPEDDRPVLVTYLGFHDRSPRTNMLAYIDKDLGWCWWNDDIPDGTPCTVEITHWMPLPEPPKKEGDRQ